MRMGHYDSHNYSLFDTYMRALLVYFFLFSEGEEWHRQRVPMSKFAMVPQNVAKFHKEFNAIVVDLLKKIWQQRDPNTQVISDVPNLLCKWSFECEFNMYEICLDRVRDMASFNFTLRLLHYTVRNGWGNGFLYNSP